MNLNTSEMERAFMDGDTWIKLSGMIDSLELERDTLSKDSSPEARIASGTIDLIIENMKGWEYEFGK